MKEFKAIINKFRNEEPDRLEISKFMGKFGGIFLVSSVAVYLMDNTGFMSGFPSSGNFDEIWNHAVSYNIILGAFLVVSALGIYLSTEWGKKLGQVTVIVPVIEGIYAYAAGLDPFSFMDMPGARPDRSIVIYMQLMMLGMSIGYVIIGYYIIGYIGRLPTASLAGDGSQTNR